MLFCQKIYNHDEKIAFFQSRDFRKTDTWVVADLKAKLSLQNVLLNRFGGFEDDSLLRASELWRKLLFRIHPDFKIVSSDLMHYYLSMELKANSASWAQKPGASRTLIRYIGYLLPVLAHPDSFEIMKSFFEEFPDSFERWGHWYLESLRVWKLLMQKRWLAPNWISAFLSLEKWENPPWERKLIVDLGPHIQSTECDLLIELARVQDILVLTPETVWLNEFRYVRETYEKLNAAASTSAINLASAFDSTPILRLNSAEKSVAPSQYRRFTTALAEVKDAVAQTRIWLENGAKPSEITIAAPDIGVYWAPLFSYLKVEGLPCTRKKMASVVTLPDVQGWLSKLNIESGSVNHDRLEAALYGPSEQPPLNYDRFRNLYYNIYGPGDLDRDRRVKAVFENEKLDSSGSFSLLVFMAWAFKCWSPGRNSAASTNINNGLENFEKIFRKMIQEAPPDLQLRQELWIKWIESLVCRMEFEESAGPAEAIECVDISSVEYIPSQYVYVMGISEENMKSQLRVSVAFEDLSRLADRAGFRLAPAESFGLEFELRWLIEKKKAHFILSYGETNFDGIVHTASPLWLAGAVPLGMHEKATLPLVSRWDELQKLPIETMAKERRWEAEYADTLSQQIEIDFGRKTLPPFFAHKIQKISAHAIEDYLKCPFIYASKRLFNLSDLPNLDLDLDSLTQGKVAHALFKRLLESPQRWDWQDEEIAALLEEIRLGEEVQLIAPDLWAPLKKKYVHLGQRFLAFEKEWSKIYPNSKALSLERDVVAYVSAKGDSISSSRSEGDFELRGRIDRVDRDDQGHAIVIDYKSSGINLRGFDNWIEKDLLQLLLYAWALDSGAWGDDLKEIIGAFYYTYKNFQRHTGFVVTELGGQMVPLGDRRKNKTTGAGKVKLYAGLQTKLQIVLDGLTEGQFAPRPRDKNDCEKCEWSELCRASHLN